MASVLITAFEPYDRWTENASWLCLLELTRRLPERPKIVTRRYPVDYEKVPKLLERDLAANHDVALHLGQAPGAGRIRLEAFAVNAGGGHHASDDELFPLAATGPAAYRSELPLAHWAQTLESQGYPARVSCHAGTYLCNATLYWSHHLALQMGLSTRSTFVHLPLETSQVVGQPHDAPSLPAELTAAAIAQLLSEIEAECSGRPAA